MIAKKKWFLGLGMLLYATGSFAGSIYYVKPLHNNTITRQTIKRAKQQNGKISAGNTGLQSQTSTGSPVNYESVLDIPIAINARNVSLEYLFSIISQEANIPIVIKDFVSDGPSATAGGQTSGQLSSSSSGSSQGSIPNSYIPGAPSSYPFGSTMLGYVSYFTGPKPLKYVLDEVCGLYDLTWKYSPEKHVIFVYRYETKMFILKMPVLQKDFSVDIDTSSANSNNNTGMAGLPGQQGATSSASIPPGNVNPATGNYKLQYQYNQKILTSIQTMLYSVLKDPGDKLNVTPMGYVLVTARPSEIKEVKEIVDRINKIMSDTIPLRITILAIQYNRELQAGLNILNFKIPDLGSKIALTGKMSLGTPANSFTIGLTNLSWNTLFSALEKIGKIHVLENDELQALNYQPIVYAPLTNQTILEGEISNVVTSTSGNTVTETPIINTIVTGSDMLIVPYRLSENKIVIDMFRNQQQLLALQNYSFNSDGNTNSFTLPSVQSTSNIQQTVLKKGQKLILLSSIVKGSNISSNGIPGLSEIPVLGWLFSQKDYQHNKYQFLIVISYDSYE